MHSSFVLEKAAPRGRSQKKGAYGMSVKCQIRGDVASEQASDESPLLGHLVMSEKRLATKK